MARGTVRDGIRLVQTSFEIPWDLLRAIERFLDKLKDECGRITTKRQLLIWLIDEFFKDEKAQERFRLWLAEQHTDGNSRSADRS